MNDKPIMKHYRWQMKGNAARGQTWETSGTVSVRLADFPSLMDRIMADNFHQLTHGKAVFGYPGIGCQGPYDILELSIRQERLQ
jgi:hypothetical protein